MSTSFRRILLVEDNPADANLVKEAFREGNYRYDICVAEDGVAAIRYLKQEGEFAGAQLPHVILLDLNLPKMDGREVLERVKSDPGLQQIPVIVLTTSADETDIQNAYRSHANCYLTKSVDLDSFWELIRSIKNFWLTLVRLPPVRSLA